MTFREVDKALRESKYCLVRICGSHHQYRKEGVPYTIVVPNHGNKGISIGVLKDLEKKTGLSLRR